METSISAAESIAEDRSTDISNFLKYLKLEELQGKRKNYLSWDDYFMAVAFLTAMRSKDPCSQVGACIVNKEKKIVGVGYNGMPIGISDDDLPWCKDGSDPLNTKYIYVCHAEMNAILNKNSADLAGCSMYVALFPCNECAKLIIQAGIKEVIFLSDKHNHKPSTVASKYMMNLAGVSFRQYKPLQDIIILDFLAADASTQENISMPNGEAMTVPLGKRDINKKRDDYLAWGEYFMALATLSALRSKDPSTQVGACIVNSANKIVGIGYNGMPQGCSDDLLPWDRENENPLRVKYMYVCHAEMNAVMNKNCADVYGCTIYVALFPCNECTKIIIQAGIKKVVFMSDKYKTKPEIIASKKMLDLACIPYLQYNFPRKKVVIDFETIDWNNKAPSEST
ncbi:hypothetical protein SK128_001849 [Halocaridina rubra]|uniref:Probable deoxycytidylate deaminase n=1 Tax=Halocaridina rubra TaxID=373956 RepID=A0AAN9AB43_HALRR